MKTSNISVLREHGFTVHTDTKSINTTISHVRPFSVDSSNNVPIDASINQHGQYQVVFEQWFPTGQMKYTINQSDTPLINKINEMVNQQVVEPTQVSDQSPTYNDVAFDQLQEGSKFTFNNKQYTKLDPNFAGLSAGTFTTAFKRPFSGDTVVQIAESDQYSSTALTDEQMQALVDHIPTDLSQDEFYEILGDDLENIPGFELADDQELHQLMTQLYTLYSK